MSKSRTIKVFHYTLLQLFLIALFALSAKAQTRCDSTFFDTAYNHYLPKIVQQKLKRIDPDSILLFRHSSSSWGCRNNVGLLAWKDVDNWKTVSFRANSICMEMQTITKKETVQLIEYLLKEKLYMDNSNLTDHFYIDDGPSTYVIFKFGNQCWELSFCAATSLDDRFIWCNKLAKSLGAKY